jgi:hypothetical protein
MAIAAYITRPNEVVHQMSRYVKAILELLTRVIEGQHVTHAEFDAIRWCAEGKLDALALEAWKNIRWWLQDADIGEKDPEYGPMRMKRLEWLRAPLIAEARRAKVDV